jgi:WD40 repeat protein
MKKNKFKISIIFLFVISTLDLNSQNSVTLIATLKGHTENISSMAFSRNGNLLATGSDFESFDNIDSGKFEIIIWDLSKNVVKGRLLGHKSPIKSISFDRSSKTIISGDSKGIIKIWDIENLKELNSIESIGWVSTILLSSDDKFLLVEHKYEKRVEILDFNSLNLISTLNIDKEIGSMDISKDGDKIALSCYRNLEIWSLISKNKLQFISDNELRGFNIKYSPDGKLLAVGMPNGDINFYNPTNLEFQFSLKEHFKPVISISFSNDSKFLLSGSSDQSAIIWNLKTKQPLKKLLNIHKGMVSHVSFNPTKPIFATTGDDKQIKLWSIK